MVSIKLIIPSFKKQAQVFTFDYIAGFVMFIIIIIIAANQLINIIPSTSYNLLSDENTYLSTTLLQPGYPADWTTAEVLIPGIATNNRLDTTKLANFDMFTYDESKSFYHISSDYVFYFKDDMNILKINGECNYGFAVSTNTTDCTINLDVLGYNNLIISNRFVIYNSSIIEMVLFSWN